MNVVIRKGRHCPKTVNTVPKGSVVGRRFGRDELVLILLRAPNAGVRSPADITALLEAGGFVAGKIVGRNPTTIHGQWWVTGISLAKTGVPYVIALGAVVRTWLKERKGRRIRLETKSLKISANNAHEVEQILKKLARYENPIESIQVKKVPARGKKNRRALGQRGESTKNSTKTLERIWRLLGEMTAKATKTNDKELSQDAGEATRLLEQLGDELHLEEIENEERRRPQIIG